MASLLNNFRTGSTPSGLVVRTGEVRNSVSTQYSYASSRSSFQPIRNSGFSEAAFSEISQYSEDAVGLLKPIPPPPTLPPPNAPLPHPPSKSQRLSSLKAAENKRVAAYPIDVDMALPSDSASPQSTHLPVPKDGKRYERSYCHNNCYEKHGNVLSCGKNSDMKHHWNHQCEATTWYQCPECSVKCVRRRDVRHHTRFTHSKSADPIAISAPVRAAFGCPHCGVLFDYDHLPPFRHHGSQYDPEPSFWSLCQDHVLKHFRDGTAKESGDSSVRVHALLRQPVIACQIPGIFRELGFHGVDDISWMQWNRQDAIAFAQKLEFGLLDHEQRVLYAGHVIDDLALFVKSLVDKSVDKSGYRFQDPTHISPSQFVPPTGQQVRSGNEKYCDPVRARTLQLLDATASSPLWEIPAVDESGKLNSNNNRIQHLDSPPQFLWAQPDAQLADTGPPNLANETLSSSFSFDQDMDVTC